MIQIQEEKKYYNQKDIVNEINQRVEYSSDELYKVLNTLEDVVKDKISDECDYVELKIFPGLIVTSKYIPCEQSKSNLVLDGSDLVLSLSVKFTDYFKRQIKKLHKDKKIS